MATTVNARDVLISGGTRTQAVTLPSDISLAGNLIGTVDGLPLANVKNSSITLSSSGVLNGAGGGSVTALPYSNVTGGPPISATSNFFTTSVDNPTGGNDGDAHFNSFSNVMWFKVDGTWQKGGTTNANHITTGTLAAARIAAGSITSDKLSVSSLSAIAANLGTVTAGNITGTASISISGSGTFNGATSTIVGNAAVAANMSDSAVHGVYARSTGTRTGVFGFNSGTGTGIQGTNTGGGIGVFGSASGVSGSKGGEFVGSGNGVTALKAGKVSGSGNALEVVGPMTISSTTLVSNLNADMVDGLHGTSFCRTIGSHSGTATVSSSHFNILSTVSGVTTVASGSNVTIAPSSDERLKQDIVPEPLGLSFIKGLRPVEYRLKARPEMKYHGFIAQDVRDLITADDDCLYQVNSDGFLGVDYVGIIAPLVNSIQDLSVRIEKLEQREE